MTYPLDCGWNDLGNWLSMEGLVGLNDEGCAVMNGNIISVDSKNNIIDVPDTLVALVGCNEMIVVEHNGSLLICDKSKAQNIRKVVDLVKKSFPQNA